MKAIAILMGVVCLIAPHCQASPPVGYSKSDAPAVDEEAAKASLKAEEKRKHLLKGADSGDVYAMVDLASLMEQGDDFAKPDRTAAFDLYERAADKGNVIGRQKMCSAYLLGESRPKDLPKGMTYCAPLGSNDAVGLFSAAYDFYFGVSGPKDEKTALSYYFEAVKLGSGDSADALGREALKMEKPEAARQWFRRGVYLGSADAMDHLAAMVQTGLGGAQDSSEAFWLYSKAAERGNSHAAEQIKDLPATMKPPVFCLFSRNNAQVRLTHTYTTKSGPKDEAIDLAKVLTEHFPTDMRGNQVSGTAGVECYVDGSNAIDACLVTKEYPVGLALGATMETLFSGKVTIAPVDMAGMPTAHRLLNQAVNFRVD